MNIIPSPQQINLFEGNIKVGFDKLYTSATGSLLEYIHQKVGNASQIDSDVYFIKTGASLENIELPTSIAGKEESYYMRCDQDGLTILAADERGLFYAVQTLLQVRNENRPFEIIDYPDIKMRGFHLEIRYSRPTFERVLEIIDMTAQYKINTFLIEYEDKFPYLRHHDVCCTDAFTLEEIEKMQNYAASRYIEIIPLQQTLGHLEYALKQDAYHHLKEVKNPDQKWDIGEGFQVNTGYFHFNDVDEICPCEEEAYELVQGLCQEMCSFHPQSRYVHIGCDEAWNLINCEKCNEKYGADGRNKLFLEHINRLCDVIIKNGKTPIIWDDMLRRCFTDEDYKQLNKQLVIMCWAYSSLRTSQVLPSVKKFRSFGFKVIAAPAAKCAEGVHPLYFDLPNFPARLENISTWTEMVLENSLEGAISTVWSNYAGMAAPPHPFFDTAWYPLIFSAEKYWNASASDSVFEGRFYENFFGVVTEMCGSFENNNRITVDNFNEIASAATKNKYVADIYKYMALVNNYRIKQNALYRELYKLFDNSHKVERQIIMRRLKEIEDLNAYLKPLIEEVLETYYSKEDAMIFVNSRFFIDEFLNCCIREKIS